MKKLPVPIAFVLGLLLVLASDAAARGRHHRHGCCCRCPSQASSPCSASLDVSEHDGEFHVTGKVDCGVKCDVDVTLSDSSAQAEGQCTAGIVRTMFRLTLKDNGCVKAEGKLCNKRPNGTWNCSGWNDLGEYCP